MSLLRWIISTRSFFWSILESILPCFLSCVCYSALEIDFVHRNLKIQSTCLLVLWWLPSSMFFMKERESFLFLEIRSCGFIKKVKRGPCCMSSLAIWSICFLLISLGCSLFHLYNSPWLSMFQALDTFNTAIVSPIYYVMFTTLTILASVIMFKVCILCYYSCWIYQFFSFCIFLVWK